MGLCAASLLGLRPSVGTSAGCNDDSTSSSIGVAVQSGHTSSLGAAGKTKHGSLFLRHASALWSFFILMVVVGRAGSAEHDPPSFAIPPLRFLHTSCISSAVGRGRLGDENPFGSLRWQVLCGHVTGIG